MRMQPERAPAFTDPVDAAVQSASRHGRFESMFGLTASVTYAFTTADIVGARNVSYAGIQVGIYAKP